MDGAHLVPTTTHTTLVRHDPHEDGIAPDDLLDPIEHDLRGFLINEVLLDEDEERVIDDVEIVLYLL